MYESAITKILNTPHGARFQTKKDLAAQLGISVATLDRRLRSYLGRQRKVRSDAGKGMETRKDAAMVVAAVMAQVPKGERQLTAKSAIGLAKQTGAISEDVSVDRVTRDMRLLGLNLTFKPCVRMEPKTVNDVWHFDGSGSENFYVLGPVRRDDGTHDFEIGVRYSYDKSYKNNRISQKQRGEDTPESKKLQVYYYGFVDGHSRAMQISVVIAAGEDYQDSLWAFDKVMRGNSETTPLRGIPKTLVTDNGPLGRSQQGISLCDGLGFEVFTNAAYEKEGNGKIEKTWGWMWRNFEVVLMTSVRKNGGKILFSELENYLQNYVAVTNQMKSTSIYAEGRTKAEMYMSQPGAIRELPADANIFQMAMSVSTRVVDSSLRVRFNNRYYKIIDDIPYTSYGKRVSVREDVEGSVSVEFDGQVYRCEDARFLDAGEFRGEKHNINHEAREMAGLAEMPMPGALFQSGPVDFSMPLPGNVVVGQFGAGKEHPQTSLGVAPGKQAGRNVTVFADWAEAVQHISDEYFEGRRLREVLGDDVYESVKPRLMECWTDETLVDAIGAMLKEHYEGIIGEAREN